MGLEVARDLGGPGRQGVLSLCCPLGEWKGARGVAGYDLGSLCVGGHPERCPVGLAGCLAERWAIPSL